VSEKFLDYANSVAARLSAAGLRAEADQSNEKLGAKIRSAQLAKIPYMLIVGEKEAEAGNVSLRKRGTGDQGAVGIDELISEAKEHIRLRSLTL
jgi:threonyl-tRNA synthetase